MAGGFVFVGKSRLRKIRKDARKLKKLETKKKSPPGGSGEWSPRSQKIKYEPLLSPRDETDNISVCSSDSAISSGSEDFLPLIDLRPESIVFTMPFGPFKKSKEQEEKKRQEEEKERQRLEEEERLRKEEEERLRKEEEEREERLRQEEEERKRKEEEEERLAEEQRLEEERKRVEAEEKKNKGVFGIALFRSKFFKPKEEKPEQEPLNAPVVEAKEAEVQQQNDVAQSQTVEEKVEEEEKKDEEDTKSLDSGIEIHKNGIDTDEQDGQKNQKVEKAKVAGEERDCTEMLCCTIM